MICWYIDMLMVICWWCDVDDDTLMKYWYVDVNDIDYMLMMIYVDYDDDMLICWWYVHDMLMIIFWLWYVDDICCWCDENDIRNNIWYDDDMMMMI